MSTSIKDLPRTLAACLLGALVAIFLVAATQTRGSAQAADDFVGPGESIQKAIYAADPGDTIVVRGVHREDVIIRKDGIKLLGQDAVIEAPPKSNADSRCSRVSRAPEGICVLGNANFETFELTGPRVNDVTVSGFTFRGYFEDAIAVVGARDATITKNRASGRGATIVNGLSIGTKIISNVTRGEFPAPDESGIGVNSSRNVTIAGNDVEGSSESAVAVEAGSTSVTVEGNDFTDNNLGILVEEKSTGARILSNDITDSTFVGTVILDSPGARILSNDMSRNEVDGIFLGGQKSQDAKVLGNDISGSAFGIYVGDAKGGSIAGNQVHDNCAGMFFESDVDEWPSDFEVTGNTVTDNTRSCRAARLDRNFSGIGIALLGARAMEVTGNQISGNVPSGPTRISGGVVVAVTPYFEDEPKPRNNTVTGNNFGRNKPDIFWDGSGTGNVLRPNNCDTSVPARLCN
jgi:parallel beta-helix repeat protein